MPLLAIVLSLLAADLKTDDQKSLYAIGFVVGSRNLGPLNLKPEELKFVEQGLSDGATGKKAAIRSEVAGSVVDGSPLSERLMPCLCSRSSFRCSPPTSRPTIRSRSTPSAS